MISTGKKQEEREIDIPVEEGIIARTKEYKYLGD